MPSRIEVFSDDALVCPNCSEDYLHHHSITIYDRTEDADLTTVTTVNDGLLSSRLMASGIIGNPSPRRHGAVITFDCEICDKISELAIAQHKGRTLIKWRG